MDKGAYLIWTWARLRVVWILAIAFFFQACGPDFYLAGYLADWTADGSRAALVPNFLDDDVKESGLWILDPETGVSRQIFRAEDGCFCLHPKWSPFNRELLFGQVRKDAEDFAQSDGRIAISIWIIGEDGLGLRKVAETLINEEDDSILGPDGISWGGTPGTVIFHEAASDTTATAILLDLYTGERRPFLPHDAEGFYFEPSPSRELVAALLTNDDGESTDVFVGDFTVARWQKLATISFKPDELPAYSPSIYWSPDSSRFVVPEEEYGQQFLRVFETQTGRSSRIAAAQPNGLIVWEPDGRALYFSGATQGTDSGIFRVDATTGELSAVVRDDNVRLLAWHAGYARLVFYRTNGEGKEKRLFSCYADGSDAQEFGRTFASKNPGWSVSPGGKRLLVISGEGFESLK